MVEEEEEVAVMEKMESQDQDLPDLMVETVVMEKVVKDEEEEVAVKMDFQDLDHQNLTILTLNHPYLTEMRMRLYLRKLTNVVEVEEVEEEVVEEVVVVEEEVVVKMEVIILDLPDLIVVEMEVIIPDHPDLPGLMMVKMVGIILDHLDLQCRTMIARRHLDLQCLMMVVTQTKMEIRSLSALLDLKQHALMTKIRDLLDHQCQIRI